MRRIAVRLLTGVAVICVGIAGAAGSGSGQAAKPSDPITANRFTITIDGYEIASFTELSAIVAEVETTEYTEVNQGGIQTNKLPGRVKPATVTLKRGLSGSLEMWAWHEAVRTGQMAAARRSCSLTMFNTDGKPVAKYWLEKAWPSKIELGGLKAGASEALLETVTLTTEAIQRVAP
jgi:phage tail-like protein